jgi:hypothetical protein
MTYDSHYSTVRLLFTMFVDFVEVLPRKVQGTYPSGGR